MGDRREEISDWSLIYAVQTTAFYHARTRRMDHQRLALRADLRAHTRGLSTGRASYWLKGLRIHDLINKIGHPYKYYLVPFGRRVLTTALAIREYIVIPTLSIVAA